MPQTNTRKTSKLLRKAFALLLPAVAVLGVFSIFINLLRLTIPLYLLQVIDRVISSQSEETLIFISIIAACALFTSAVLMSASMVIQNRLGTWFEERLFEPVMKASIFGKLTNQTNGAQTIRDLGLLRMFFSSPTILTLFEVPWTPIFIGIIFILHPYLGFFSASVGVLLFLFALLNDFLVADHQRESQKNQETVNRGLERAMINIDSILAMGMTLKLVKLLRKHFDSATRNRDKANERSGIIKSLIRWVRSLAQIGILGLGAYLVLQGDITTGSMIAAMILMGLGLSPIDQAVNAIRTVKITLEARHRISHQLSAIDLEEFSLDFEENKPLTISVRKAMYMPRSLGKPVLRPLQFDLEAGLMVGILGPSAAGKTTLCRLIVGAIKPTSGSVLVNDLEIGRLFGSDFGNRVGFMPQKPMATNGTIADNIARFAPQTDHDRSAAIAKAAKLIGIHETILGLPHRYNTVLDEQGILSLSCSQFHQIFLARAMYGNPRLLVLDEPTTFLDKAGQANFKEALEILHNSGTTIIVVSQSPQIMKACDKILVLRDGAMVNFGNSDEVLANLSNTAYPSHAQLVDVRNPNRLAG